MVYFTPPDRNDCITRITLDGTEYILKFSYNNAGEFWTLGIIEERGKPVVAGMKIVPSFPMNAFLKDRKDLPQGILAAFTSEDRIERKTFSDGDARLYFIPWDDLEGQDG